MAAGRPRGGDERPVEERAARRRRVARDHDSHGPDRGLSQEELFGRAVPRHAVQYRLHQRSCVQPSAPPYHWADDRGGALRARARDRGDRSEEHTSELQSRLHLVCRLLLEKKKNKQRKQPVPVTDGIDTRKRENKQYI